MKNFLLSKVAFTLFGIDIYWYGIIITSAIILDFFILMFFCKKRGFDQSLPYDLVLVLLPSAIFMARLFAVIFEPDLTLADYFDFKGGGLSILGALVGGTIGLVVYCHFKKLDFFRLADILAPLVILGQAIGRWGNYFNGEVYGKEILDESLQWFPLAVQIGGEWYEALFFYEFVLNLIGFALLVTLLYTFKKKRGIVLGAYLIYYGIIRFFLETRRQAEFVYKVGNVAMSQLIAGLMAVAGLILLIVLYILDCKKKKKLNQTVRAYNGQDESK